MPYYTHHQEDTALSFGAHVRLLGGFHDDSNHYKDSNSCIAEAFRKIDDPLVGAATIIGCTVKVLRGFWVGLNYCRSMTAEDRRFISIGSNYRIYVYIYARVLYVHMYM
jgi:hypothetical protein